MTPVARRPDTIAASLSTFVYIAVHHDAVLG